MNETAIIHTSLFTIPQPFVDLIVQLISTLIGVVVGFGLVLWLDRKKEKEQETITTNRMLETITEELKTIQKEIVNPSTKVEWYSAPNRYFMGTRIHVITPAFDSAVNSGDFSLLSQSLQKELGSVYLRIRNCELYNNQIDNFYFTPLFVNNTSREVDREAIRLVTKFNDQMEYLKKEIIDILPKLESAKKLL